MSNQMNLPNTLNVISSPASAGGRSLCNSQAGPQLDLFGLDRVLVSHSQPQAKDSAPQTNGTSGPCSPNSSAPASLPFALANRLRQRLAGNGSLEYSLTWKEWAISGQEPICALRASAHRTSGKGCGGWPTPGEDNANNAYGHKGTNYSDLPTAAQAAGWPTPDAQNMNGGADLETHMARLERLKEKHNNGNGAGIPLAIAAQMAGWATPTTRDHKDGTAKSCENVPLNKLLGREVHLSGQPQSGTPAATAKPAALNPAFSLWLMGYPAEWASCGARAMQSSRKSRRSS